MRLSPDMDNQRGTNQHEGFPACFSDLNGFALGRSVQKSHVSFSSVTVCPHPSDLDALAGRCLSRHTVGVIDLCLCVLVISSAL